MYYRQPFSGDYPISQYFGETITDPDGHKGIDYLCPAGTPVLASEAGTVIKAGWDNTGYGNCVMIQHQDGNATLYAHLSQIYVTVGQKVVQSQVIGLSGNTGNSTGPHLHFEARSNPADYKSAFDPFDLPLHSMNDDQTVPPAPVEQPKKLKSADAFSAGEILEIKAPLGAKGFKNKNFTSYDVYQQGTDLLYTGETTQHNKYTYMLCYPIVAPVWIAVNDGACQIIDKR